MFSHEDLTFSLFPSNIGMSTIVVQDRVSPSPIQQELPSTSPPHVTSDVTTFDIERAFFPLSSDTHCQLLPATILLALVGSAAGSAWCARTSGAVRVELFPS